MKILYIPSGHKGIYTFFDRSLFRAFNKLSIPFVVHHPLEPIQKLTELLLKFQPDLALTMIGDKIPLQKLKLMKKRNVPATVWLTEDPYYLKKTIQYAFWFDFVFTVDRFSAGWYQKQGIQNAFYLPLGTDFSTFYPKQAAPLFKSDICIIGYPYENRKKLAELLIKETPYRLKLVGLWKLNLSKHQQKRVSVHYGWVSPGIASSYYNSAEINVNTLRPINDSHNDTLDFIPFRSLNNRTFDLAVWGAFQIAEKSDDLEDFFMEEEEICIFSDFQEAVQKIDRYMKNKQKRERIGRNAQKTAKSRDSFENRLKQMIDSISGKNE